MFFTAKTLWCSSWWFLRKCRNKHSREHAQCLHWTSFGGGQLQNEWFVSLSPWWITPSFVSFPSGGNHIKWSPVFGSSLSCLNGSHLDGEEKDGEEWGRKHPHNTNSAQQKHPLPFLRIHLHSNIPLDKYKMWKSLSYFCAWSSWDAVWACLGCLRLPAPQSSRPPTLGLQWHNVYLSHSKAKESKRDSGAEQNIDVHRLGWKTGGFGKNRTVSKQQIEKCGRNYSRAANRQGPESSEHLQQTGFCSTRGGSTRITGNMLAWTVEKFFFFKL